MDSMIYTPEIDSRGYVRDGNVYRRALPEESIPGGRIVFHIQPALNDVEVHERIVSNMQIFRDVFPRIVIQPPKLGEIVTMCAYGPSLRKTFLHIVDQDIITCSGAHDFISVVDIKHKKWIHVECDPRIHKGFFLKNARKDVSYYLASIMHPDVLNSMRGFDVTLWHPITKATQEELDWFKGVDHGSLLLAGGSNIGVRGIVVAYALGYREFDLHGYDCSYDDGYWWAGQHSGKKCSVIKVKCNGKVFYTSDVLLRSCDELLQLFSILKCQFHVRGDGLLGHRIRMMEKDQEKALSNDWYEYLGAVQ